MNRFTLAIAAFALSAGSAMSATYSPINLESNGNRPGATSDNNSPAQVVNPDPIGPGQNVGIAGRIVNSIDQWEFTTEVEWSMSFVDLHIDDQAYFDNSDIVTPPSDDDFDPAGNGDPSRAAFSLWQDGSMLYDFGVIFATDGGVGTEDALDYSGVAGTFLLKIDGRGFEPRNRGATYDIGISTVPVPAAGLLLLAGLGGLGVMKRRQKES